MSSLCFVCELPILSHQTWGNWPKHTEENQDEKEQVDLGTRGSTYHEDCLSCETCGFRLNGSNFNRARRYKDKIYCALHYADVSGLVSGDEFMQKLREFKRQSLGCAEARRKSSTTLQFPTPVQACPGNGACASYSHFIKPTPGYWIECSGSDGGSNNNPSQSTGNVTIKVSKQQSDGGSDTNSPFELMSLEEETYDKYFYATEHWNYFTNDEALGPVILSIKQENINNRDQFRVMLRTVSYRLNGLVPASCICADRYDREAVVRSLGDEASLKPRLVLGQLPSTPDELLKLDQVFIKSELKVGVVYVKEGQSTEEHILDNTTHSALFEEFLSILGDRVRLKGFDKYKGGLDTVHDLTGTESIYTSWRGIEIMFHVATLLPHEDHDPQKLQKKRHIGNDIVCVAFLEADDTLFSPACIKSHFLHTFIAVRTSPKKTPGVPTKYEVSVVSRDEVGAYKPYLWHRSKFEKDVLFREWLLTKIVNGERASYSAPKFARMQDRTRSQMLEDIVANLQNHAETGQIPKPYRRGSWRPIGHMRPSSPLLDSVRDTFEGYEQLAKDFTKAFQSNHQLCDVIFNVGQGKDKTKVYAVRAILGIRSRVFLEMLYGFTTGYGLSPAPMESISRVETPKSSNFLQVPDINEPPRNKTPSSPMVWRYFSRLGSWAGWGMGSRSSSKTHLASDPGGLKRWQSEFDCKEKTERKQSLAGTTVALSVCADAHKVDRVKLCQTEFNIIEFDSDTFRILIDYLQSGSCPLTCETVPGLICAAEHYDLPELLQACFHHAKQHLRIAVVCSMLNTLENYYWRYTSASELVNTILQHVDAKAAQLFSRREFLDLSESMFQMIVGRELGNIPEVKKFEVMLQWANHKVNNMGHPGTSSSSAKNENPTFYKEQLRKASINQLQLDRDYYPRELQCTMNRLTRDLKLYKIPPQDLIKVVLPTKTISNERILETLLFQADTGMYRIQPSYLDQCRKLDDDDEDDYILEQKLQKLPRNSKR